MTNPPLSERSELPLRYTHPPEPLKTAQRTNANVACPRCDKRWGGFNTAHCTVCHETFTGITAFDTHRTGSHEHSTRRCQPPADLGLINANRSYPCWGFPTGDNPWADQ